MRSNSPTALLLGALGVGIGAWLLTRNRSVPTFSYADKVVVITGGSRGLGLVLARRLAKEGARLALYARDAEELERAKTLISQEGVSPLTIACDVTSLDQARNAIRQTEEQLGPVDVLINNAGIISVGPLSAMGHSDFEKALGVTFWASYNMAESVLPGMIERGAGRIVNISSIGGQVSVPHLLPYCVGKFALVGYSRGLHSELAQHGIRVTTVCPGLMRTGSPRNAIFKGNHQAEYAWFKISDSLPLITVSAEQAADEIIEACRQGQAELVISTPAKFGVLLQSLFPEATANLLALVNRVLPSPGNAEKEAWLGKESESALSSSSLTLLTDCAARENNQMTAQEEMTWDQHLTGTASE